ncbi:hypothetical protein ACHAWF_015736 [Thalassiosira exigua]
MANKAVVSVAALGLGAYAVSENFKDWRARRERRAEAQERRDREDAWARRLEEARKKEGEHAASTSGKGDFLLQRAFAAGVFARVEEILYDLVLGAGDTAKPSRRDDLRRLDLPLMSDDYDQEDLMLAAAFALGDDKLVERVAKLFRKQKLGIGLVKFPPSAILHIIETFEGIAVPDINDQCLNLFVRLGIYNDSFQSGEPYISPIHDKFATDYLTLVRFSEEFGFHVTRDSTFNFSPNWRRRTFRLELDHRKRKENLRRGVERDAQILVGNFMCSFTAPFRTVGGDDGSVVPDLDRVSLRGKKHCRVAPNTRAMAGVLAQRIASSMAKVAAKRLRSLVSRRRGGERVSHEHIAVCSGYDGDLLKVLEDSDQAMILGNKDMIRSTLRETLKRTVPQSETGEHGDLRNDIESFIEDYLKLITLSYCEIPRFGGSPPSSFVPEYDVPNEAKDGTIWKTSPMLIHSTRRMLVKGERERISRSRMIVSPRGIYALSFIGSSWALISWVCWFATKTLLHCILPGLYSICIPMVIAQAFTLWTLYSLVAMMKAVLSLSREESSWHVVICCTEYIQRTLSTMLGRPTPFDQELKRLNDKCQSQYRIWKVGIAKRNFYAALKRKRITNRECLLLLTNFANKYVEKGDKEIVTGVLPVPLTEAEEFLKLKVEENVPCAEIPLTADESLKNYLETESDQRANYSSPIEDLHMLSYKVHDCVQLSEGDRVIVNSDLNSSNCEGTCADDNAGLSDCTELVYRRSRTASVAFCTATLCFVHFDGEPVEIPTPVPINLCSILDEHSLDEHQCHSTEDDDEDLSFSRAMTESLTLNDEDDVDEEKRAEPIPQPQSKARTVEEALRQGGWKLVRSKNHLKYSRRVNVKKETVTLSKTSSDWRASRNALSLLRRLNDDSEAEQAGEKPAANETSNGHLSEVLCSCCCAMKSLDQFSKNQLKKCERRKCKVCVSDAS